MKFKQIRADPLLKQVISELQDLIEASTGVRPSVRAAGKILATAWRDNNLAELLNIFKKKKKKKIRSMDIGV